MQRIMLLTLAIALLGLAATPEAAACYPACDAGEPIPADTPVSPGYCILEALGNDDDQTPTPGNQ